MRTRLVAAVTATSIGLAFWWALTEPLPVPPVILLAVPAAILFCAGVLTGRAAVLALHRQHHRDAAAPVLPTEHAAGVFVR